MSREIFLLRRTRLFLARKPLLLARIFIVSRKSFLFTKRISLPHEENLHRLEESFLFTKRSLFLTRRIFIVSRKSFLFTKRFSSSPCATGTSGCATGTSGDHRDRNPWLQIAPLFNHGQVARATRSECMSDADRVHGTTRTGCRIAVKRARRAPHASRTIARMPLLRSRPELLAGFRRGERAALTAVYWAYVDRVERTVRYGYSIVSRGDVRVPGAHRDEIVDAVQETFLRAFEERARLAYDGQRDYAPYLRTIARNLLADRARKLGRELSFDALAESEDLDRPSAADDDEAWATPETMRVVTKYLASLGDELRALHRERYERGLSQQEAAAALGWTRQQLRTREARLRDGLAGALRHAKIGE